MPHSPGASLPSSPHTAGGPSPEGPGIPGRRPPGLAGRQGGGLWSELPAGHRRLVLHKIVPFSNINFSRKCAYIRRMYQME